MAALDPRPQSVDTQTHFFPRPSRALPAPWASVEPPPLDVSFAIRPPAAEQGPGQWDKEMMEMCSSRGYQELKGSVKELVEPYGKRKRAAERRALEGSREVYHG